MKLVYDIECDALEATKIWCAVLYNLDTNQIYKYTHLDDGLPSIEDAVATLSNAEVLIGHNIINYDNLVIQKLYGVNLNEKKVYDTWIMSQTLRYKRSHKHGLAGWGEALGDNKIYFDANKFPKGDDPVILKEMLTYCVKDVIVNTKVYKHLLKEFTSIYNQNNKIREGLKIEHDAAIFNAEVKSRGWNFDTPKAKSNLERMNKRMREIENAIEPHLGERLVYVDKEPKFPKYKKNGNYNVHTVRALSDYFSRPIREEDTHLMAPGTPFQRSYMEPITLGSIDLVKKWLQEEKGWKPDEWTMKKDGFKWIKQSPKFTKTSMESLGELGKMIDEYYTLRNRASVIEGLLKQVIDGRIHGNMWVIGTPTFRARHEVIVNLPGVEAAWGKEIRELFIADEGTVVVGADSSGNQLRGLCHYVGDDEFTKAVVSGKSEDGTDAHSRNASILGCSRAIAKNFLYAYLFGAGDTKLGKTLSGKPDAALGKQKRDEFGKGIKGLVELRQWIGEQWKRTFYQQGQGWFPAIDGRPVFADSEHQTLNYLLQVTEAITCKAALSYSFNKIKEEGLRAQPRLFYHDELAYVSHPDDAARVGEILQESFREAPKTFGIECMDGGSPVTGRDYSDVH